MGVSIAERVRPGIEIPSAQDIAEEIINNGASIKEAVKKLRKGGADIAEFYINEKLTYWTRGTSLGEDVFSSLFDQGPFKRKQRVCWELMYFIMDEVHRKPVEQYK